MSKFVVTGGCGFIGSHLVDFLIDEGHDVTVIDKSTRVNTHSKVKYHYGDIRQSLKNPHEVFEGAECIFHLAAEIHIQKSLQHPEEFSEVNVHGTKNMLAYAEEFSVSKFIFASTSAIYGNTKYDRASLELDEPDLLNAYAQSKYDAERLSEEYSKSHQIDISVLRYCNVYGNGQLETGMYASVVGSFLRQLRNNESLTLTGDGNQQRDFIHVQDVVNATYAAYQHNRGFNIYNIGSGKSISILDVAKLLSNDISFSEPRMGEPFRTSVNIEKAYSHLGWRPVMNIESFLKHHSRL